MTETCRYIIDPNSVKDEADSQLQLTTSDNIMLFLGVLPSVRRYGAEFCKETRALQTFCGSWY